MINLNWRKHIAVWRNRLYLYPAPDAMPHTRLFWLATGLVTLFVLLFAGYFIFYLTGRHDAYITSAEDLGIMDQAIWNTLHGQILHQTICNIVNDTNCYSINGISRFAIHFEPILFPVSLFYLIWPGPKTLLVMQTLVVASGAFPAFWLARLRLRNELAAVAIALLYLLYPSLQQAEVFDFHAVTFTASFLLFTLYFMYTRRTAWLFVFAILSLACKEEISLVILVFGLWTILFQQRWRSGLALMLLSIGWLGLGLLVVHIYSPTGRSLLASLYTQLGNSPLAIARTVLLHPVLMIKQYVLEPFHLLYLRILLSPAGYLPLLAPWALVLAVPSLALNLFSSNPNMHSGFFQYNAEIVPLLVFAAIEGIVVILWIVQWATSHLKQRRQKQATSSNNSSTKAPYAGRWVHIALLVILLSYVMYNVGRADVVRGAMPFSSVPIDGFQGTTEVVTTYQWQQTNAHTELAQHFIDMIPATASVSAQSHLVPHISERTNIYLFPYADDRADYLFLDVTGNTYPLLASQYIHEVKRVLLDGNYGVVAAQDGYLLLKRGLPAVGISSYSAYLSSSDPSVLLPKLPDEFCSFAHVAPQTIQNPLSATFTAASAGAAASMNLSGLSVYAPPLFSLSNGALQVSTYWKVNAPTPFPLNMLITVTDKNGKDHFATLVFPALAWCPTNTWQPGMVYFTTSEITFLKGIPDGLAHISIALLPVTHPFGTIMDEQGWLPVQVVNAPHTVISNHGGKALQVATVSIFP